MEQSNTNLRPGIPLKQSVVSSSQDPRNVSPSQSRKSQLQTFDIENNDRSSSIVKSQQLQQSTHSALKQSVLFQPDPQNISFANPPTSSRHLSLDNQNKNEKSSVVYSEHRQLYPESNESPLDNLRKLKLFPIFGDKNIAKFSINYFLYLEFFRIAIKVFCIMFVFSGIGYIVAVIKQDAIESSLDNILYVYGGFTLAAAILLKVLLSYETKKLVENPILHDFQWTEDLFSVLVEGLPRDAREEEITNYFTAIVGAQVKEVILLQDSYRHAKLKGQIERLKEKIDKLERKAKRTEKNEKERTKLLLELEAKNIELSQTEQELLANGHYKGNAIVIFHTTQAKYTIVRYLKVSILVRPWLYCFDSFYKKNRLRGSLLSVSDIPEPEDLIFSNIHGARRNFYKPILAYFGSVIIILVSLGGLTYLKGSQLFVEVQSNEDETSNIETSYILTVGILVFNLLLDRLYRYVNIFFRYKSRMKAQIKVLNYGLFISFILYILIQIIPAFLGLEAWLEQLIRVLLLYFVKLILIKGFTVFCTKSAKEAKSLTSPLLSIRQRLHNKYVEFDFIAGLNRVVPLILMPFTFLLLNPPLLLGIAIICLYGCAIVDKYRMLRCCNVFKMKSSAFIIRTFRIFKWDLPCLVWGSALVIQALWVNKETFDDLLNNIFIWLAAIFLIVIVLFYICLSKSLNARFRTKFLKKSAEVEYDSVCKEFTATYKEKDPVRQIMRSTYLGKK